MLRMLFTEKIPLLCKAEYGTIIFLLIKMTLALILFLHKILFHDQEVQVNYHDSTSSSNLLDSLHIHH